LNNNRFGKGALDLNGNVVMTVGMSTKYLHINIVHAHVQIVVPILEYDCREMSDSVEASINHQFV